MYGIDTDQNCGFKRRVLKLRPVDNSVESINKSVIKSVNNSVYSVMRLSNHLFNTAE